MAYAIHVMMTDYFWHANVLSPGSFLQLRLAQHSAELVQDSHSD
jgi:hypothetical protein